MAHVEEELLEHPASEEAEPGQGLAGGGAEVTEGELQGGEQGLIAFFGGCLLELGQELHKVRANGLGCEGAQVRADQFQRKRVVGKIVQQRIESLAAEPGIAQGNAVAFQDLREQPQAVGAGEALKLIVLCAGKPLVARTAGDEQAPPALAGGEIAEQFGEAAALVVGVGAVVGGGCLR